MTSHANKPGAVVVYLTPEIRRQLKTVAALREQTVASLSTTFLSDAANAAFKAAFKKTVASENTI
jgi:hypothetical protein